ncbi:extracellular matrix regulator RemB [Texcoconibacillus texcoconensis]|uniref:DUF370 domain-containing protein n=1 Tax=Texcoconibacillus texcoconensis TaxID=1095777 RepID=A0A840QU21_9BACI|nr:extracellular matrix/biofilm biosynthesis regulator RemA family protein [Texcoconibacillus texcoconensis]MBB5174788.1 hypothetical protein [Texcoconibacillus texcoconensis]
MFVHIGSDTVIRSRDIVAILESQNQGSTQVNQDFVNSYSEEKDDRIEVTEDETKSVVVTTEKVYMSPISSMTLKRRAEQASDFEDESEFE